MRAVMLMFDTLCRHFLPPYGGAELAQAPNFQRLAARTCQFQNAYVGSMPCMPARRELHTGRYNFLHSAWGPLEPYDDSMPEQLGRAGIHTHLVTDHYHYFEDGGATYHHRYNTWEGIRGQEGDRWHGLAGPVPDYHRCRNRGGVKPRAAFADLTTQDWINRSQFTSEATMPQARTVSQGLDFVRRNAAFQDWFCQIETFDPHEPFFTQKVWQDLYPHDWDETVDGVWDWPQYKRITESGREVAHMRAMYKALVSMCDHHLGRVLDVFDELDLWQDTMLIVNTDHGFLLGEHDHWAKCHIPWYQELSHVPLWVWDPRSRMAGVRREALVQTIDLAPTLLEFFGQPIPNHCQGRPLRAVIERDEAIRAGALFGIFGAQVNWTDGRHVYMRGPVGDTNGPLYDYRLMPTHMNRRFSRDELQDWQRHPGFAYSQGCPLMAIARGGPANANHATRLWDVQADPGQTAAVDDPGLEARIIGDLVKLMAASEAPVEQYHRLGLPLPRG